MKVMPNPGGKCFFCSRTDLTKSHIWPEWAQKVVPSTAIQYEIKRGSFSTYTPNTNVEEKSTTVKAGSVAARRPRNTCFGCNSGWMREIEEYAQPSITALMRGDRILLRPAEQYAVATFLCLVATRIDASAKIAHPIPAADHEHLIRMREPNSSWKIWLMKFLDGPGNDYWYNQFPMALKSIPKHMLETLSPLQLSAAAQDCNTQVTTVVVGRLCAHMFSTTAYHEFTGYEEPAMTQIWPINGLIIDTKWLPGIHSDEVHWLHEAIGRDRNPPDFRHSG